MRGEEGGRHLTATPLFAVRMVSVRSRTALSARFVGDAEIAPFNGEDGKQIYIAVDGVVFNISSHPTGQDFYGPGCGYNCFAGR
jgi:hypothetical protein